MKCTKMFFVFSVVLTMLALAISCKAPLAPTAEEAAQEQAGSTGTLYVNLPGVLSRSMILPGDFVPAFYDIRLTRSDAEPQEYNGVAPGARAVFAGLKLGEWTVMVIAKSHSGEVLGTFEGRIIVQAGDNTLSPDVKVSVSGSDGLLSLEWLWDPSLADTVEVALNIFDGEKSNVTPPFIGEDVTVYITGKYTVNIAEGRATIDASLPPGDYILTLTFKKNDVVTGVKREIIRIAGNHMTQSPLIDLRGVDFSRRPKQLEKIGAYPLDPLTLQVYWEGDDPLVDYYKVIRDYHDTNSPHRKEWLVPASQKYIFDTTFNHSVIHSYAVIAINRNGATEPELEKSLGYGTVILVRVDSDEFGGQGKDVVTDPDVVKVVAKALITISGNDVEVGSEELYIQEPRSDWTFLPGTPIWFDWLTVYLPGANFTQAKLQALAYDAEDDLLYYSKEKDVTIPTTNLERLSVFSTKVPPERVVVTGVPNSLYGIDSMPNSFTFSFTSPNATRYRYRVEARRETTDEWSIENINGVPLVKSDVPLGTDLVLQDLPDNEVRFYRIVLAFADDYGNWTEEGAYTYSWRVTNVPIISIDDPIGYIEGYKITGNSSVTFQVNCTWQEATNFKYRVSLKNGDSWSVGQWSDAMPLGQWQGQTRDPLLFQLNLNDFGYTDGTAQEVRVEFCGSVVENGDIVWFEDVVTDYTWIIDQAPPVLTLTTPAPQSELNGRAYESASQGVRLEGSVSDYATVLIDKVQYRYRPASSTTWDGIAWEDASISQTTSFSVLAGKENGTWDISVRALDKVGSSSEPLVYEDVKVYTGHPVFSFTQTSAVGPGGIVANGGLFATYNWDQEVWATQTNSSWEGSYQYSLDNGTTWQDYSPGQKHLLTHGFDNVVLFRTRFGGTAGTVYEEIVGHKYTINYHAYGMEYEFIGGSEAPSGNVPGIPVQPNVRVSSSENVQVVIKYTPRCGETFSIYRGVKSQSMTSDNDIPATWSGFDFGGTFLNRMDTIDTQVSVNQTASVNIQDYTVQGRDYAGGMAERVKYFLKIDGRSYTPDPANSGYPNPDLAPEKNNIVKLQIIIVKPKLVTKAIDMYARPAITPYLWLRQEPIVQVDVTAIDYFTGVESPATNAKVYFRVQYGDQRSPYAQLTGYSINWDTSTTGIDGYAHPGWNNPTGTEPAAWQAVTGQALQIIDIDPLPSVASDGKRWVNNGGTMTPYYKTIPAQAGRAYYQIDNPYDTYKIGEYFHYYNSNGSLRESELDNYAFRTVVRFRVRAMKSPGYRDANNTLRSFESNTAATFMAVLNGETTLGRTVRALGPGTLPNPNNVSDFPQGFQSYPIEVCENWEGVVPQDQNPVGEDWYGKHGIIYVGSGQGAAGKANLKNEADDSRFKHFSFSRTKVLVYSHGMQPTGYYEVPYQRADSNYFNFTNMLDESSYKFGTSGLSYGAGNAECFPDYWIARGYNFAMYHWNKWSNSTRKINLFFTSVNVPGPGETKVWFPAGAHGNAMFKNYSLRQGNNPTDILADSIRSANQGMILAQEILDSLPAGYEPEEIAIAGHSLGNNLVILATYNLVKAELAGKIPQNRVPRRVDLLDPYYGTLTSDDKGTMPWIGDEFKYISTRSTQDYANVLHIYMRGGSGIPIQWFRTTALTQDTLGENDDNYGLMAKVNFVKFYYSDSKAGGYVKADKWQNGNIHAEAHDWYFRSIQRDVSQDWNGSALIGISAATPYAYLWTRLNGVRGESTITDSTTAPLLWTVFHLNTGDSSHKKVDPRSQTFQISNASGALDGTSSSASTDRKPRY